VNSRVDIRRGALKSAASHQSQARWQTLLFICAYSSLPGKEEVGVEVGAAGKVQPVLAVVEVEGPQVVGRGVGMRGKEEVSPEEEGVVEVAGEGNQELQMQAGNTDTEAELSAQRGKHVGSIPIQN
jgi:hypothetical protein